jgi:hypothetical protein
VQVFDCSLVHGGKKVIVIHVNTEPNFEQFVNA